MSNKLTIIIDSNYLLISRYSVLSKNFDKRLPEHAREAARENLTDMMARSIIGILNKFPEADNIILVRDGGSWRKQLKVPSVIKDVAYKGNRRLDENTDWNCVFGALDNIIKRCDELGITVSSGLNSEGDDWIWYWSHVLNGQGTNVLIWSSDNDLKQLVSNGKAFTAWYNDRSGLFIHEDLIKRDINPLDFFMDPSIQPDQVLESLVSHQSIVEHINPETIAIDKIFLGDYADNIKPIVHVKRDSGRACNFTQKDLDILKNDITLDCMNGLLEHKNDVINWIAKYSKFTKFKLKREDISEMLEYNIKLVWLDDHCIPATLIQSMNECEYKQFDLKTIRSNYRMIIGDRKEEQYIANLFES